MNLHPKNIAYAGGLAAAVAIIEGFPNPLSDACPQVEAMNRQTVAIERLTSEVAGAFVRFGHPAAGRWRTEP